MSDKIEIIPQDPIPMPTDAELTAALLRGESEIIIEQEMSLEEFRKRYPDRA